MHREKENRNLRLPVVKASVTLSGEIEMSEVFKPPEVPGMSVGTRP